MAEQRAAGAPIPPPGTNLIVVAHPVLGVERGHVAEAVRALRASGRDADEERTLRYLWSARALPTCLDVLSDARCAFPLDETRIAHVTVDVATPLTRTSGARPLLAIARFDEEDSSVAVQIVEREALLRAESDASAAPWCTVTFHLDFRDEDDEPTDVSVRRFSVGHPP